MTDTEESTGEEQQEELPDPEELREKADRWEESGEKLREARSLLSELSQNDNFDDTSRKRLDFINEMLGLIMHRDSPGKRAHDTRQYARHVENELAKREHMEESEA